LQVNRVRSEFSVNADRLITLSDIVRETGSAGHCFFLSNIRQILNFQYLPVKGITIVPKTVKRI
jgi:hypothetical protein